MLPNRSLRRRVLVLFILFLLFFFVFFFVLACCCVCCVLLPRKLSKNSPKVSDTLFVESVLGRIIAPTFSDDVVLPRCCLLALLLPPEAFGVGPFIPKKSNVLNRPRPCPPVSSSPPPLAPFLSIRYSSSRKSPAAPYTRLVLPCNISDCPFFICSR